jgi:hypothetical protein
MFYIKSLGNFVFEAGAVLAGTMLMASGISGDAPDTFDSNTTLSKLLPSIAAYRDQFYMDLLEWLPPAHRERLQIEAEARRQPFGRARQDLNRQLARLRASQLVNCRLASIFARMGFGFNLQPFAMSRRQPLKQIHVKLIAVSCNRRQ